MKPKTKKRLKGITITLWLMTTVIIMLRFVFKLPIWAVILISCFLALYPAYKFAMEDILENKDSS